MHCSFQVNDVKGTPTRRQEIPRGRKLRTTGAGIGPKQPDRATRDSDGA
jgi:hypothetical protein